MISSLQIILSLFINDSSMSCDEICSHLSENMSGDVTPPDIQRNLTQLVRDGKIRHLRNGEYKLTAKGRNEALPVLEANWVYRTLNGKPLKAPDTLSLLTSGYIESLLPTGERREAVIFPRGINHRTILNDLSAQTAERFKAIANATQKDLETRVSVIRVNCMEDGLKACLYLSLKQEEMDSDDIDDELALPEAPYDFSLSDMGDEVYSDVLPIVRMSSLRFQRDDTQGYPFGSMLGSGVVSPALPWWNHYSGDIIIYCNYNYLGMELTDAISLFDKCNHIYALVPDVPERSDGDFVISEDEEEQASDVVPPSILKAILRFEAAQYIVPSSNNVTYYTKIITGLAKKHKLKISEDFSFADFVTALLDLERALPATRMEELIRYHAKRSDKKYLDNSILTMIKRIDGPSTKELSGFERLNAMAGLEEIKKQIYLLVNSFKAAKIRRQAGLPSVYPCCIAMLGNPGTAKTTICEILSQILFSEHLLPSKRMTSITGAGLQGPYVGSTSFRVKEIFDSDVVFIDEYYSIDSVGTYAQEALGELCVQIEKAQAEGNKLIVLAGYGGKSADSENNKMLKAINANPGISSRISLILDFPDYSPEECSDIFFSIAASKGYMFEDDEPIDKAREALTAYFAERVNDTTTTFGNGREARSIFQESVRISADRIFSSAANEELLTGEELSKLRISDVLDAIASVRLMNASKAGKAPKCISIV